MSTVLGEVRAQQGKGLPKRTGGQRWRCTHLTELTRQLRGVPVRRSIGNSQALESVACEFQPSTLLSSPVLQLVP